MVLFIDIYFYFPAQLIAQGNFHFIKIAVTNFYCFLFWLLLFFFAIASNCRTVNPFLQLILRFPPFFLGLQTLKWLYPVQNLNRLVAIEQLLLR